MLSNSVICHFFVLGLLLMMGEVASVTADSLQMTDELGHLPLVDVVRKRPFTIDEMQGKVCVFDCARIHCEGPCRIIAGKLHKIECSFSGNNRILFVTLLLDGQECTPEEVRVFSQGDADRSDNVYLKGSDDTIEKSLEAVYSGIMFDAVKGGLLLNTRWVVVDQSSRIFGYYSSLDKDERGKMVTDIQSLLRSVR